uniref:Retroviral polymerase SH3-like domain-containing protein n=1 Tax=Tanacetum cinerariifolium TaxID=118510 RepID=A0A6L2M1J3_TANCI|nr:hypothetical protein [Tanacetum cinerariifolium]
MSRTIPPIPPPLETNSGNTGSPNRVDTIPTTNDSINITTTTSVAQNIVDEIFLNFLIREEAVIKCKTAKAMWNDLILAHEGPFDTRDTKIATLRLKFNAFKAFDGEKVNGTFIRLKCLLNDLENNDVVIPPAEDDKYVSSKDEGTIKVKAFMEIAEEEPSVGKADARFDQLGKFDEKADDGFFLGYSQVEKAFRVFNIGRQEMEETYHVTFSEYDEAISQSSIEGDAINFNENCSFPDDELLKPRSKVTQGLRNIDYFPYSLAYEPLPSNNTTILENNITPTDLPIPQDAVSPKEPPEFTSADDYLALNDLDHPELADNLKPAEIQDIVISEPISNVQPSLITISPSAKGEPMAGITTRSRIRDSKAALSHKGIKFPNHVCKLDKALYELKQALRACALVKCPMLPSNNLGPDKPGVSVNETFFRGMIGSLMHLTDSGLIFNFPHVSVLVEAKYVAATGCCAQVLWIKSQLADYDVLYDKVSLHQRPHFKRHELHFLPTYLQLADIFIKLLAEPSFTRLVAELDTVTNTISLTLLNFDKPLSFDLDVFSTVIRLKPSENCVSVPPKETVKDHYVACHTAKAPTDLKSKKQRITPSSKPRTLKLVRQILLKKQVTNTEPAEEMVATANITQNQNVEEEMMGSGMSSLGDVTFKKIIDEYDQKINVDQVKPESPYDTESKIKVIKSFCVATISGSLSIDQDIIGNTALLKIDHRVQETLQTTMPDLISKPLNKEFNSLNTLEIQSKLDKDEIDIHELINLMKDMEDMALELAEEVKAGKAAKAVKEAKADVQGEPLPINTIFEPKNAKNDMADPQGEQSPNQAPSTIKPVSPESTALVVHTIEEPASKEKISEEEPPFKRLNFLISNPITSSPNPLSTILPQNIYLEQFTGSLFQKASSEYFLNPPKFESKRKGIKTEENLMKDLIPLMEEGRANELPISKISYKINRVTKDATMRIERNIQPLSLTVYENFRLNKLTFSKWIEVHTLTSSNKSKANDILLKNLKAKFEWIKTQDEKLGIPPRPELSTYRLFDVEKKRKRSLEII